MIIDQNDKAILKQIAKYQFEIFIKLKDKSGNYFEPKDENFGVWAWSSCTLKHAREIFAEITDGRRGIRQMIEIES